MNQLSTAERSQIIAALVEGNSIRSTSRMTGISKTTILKLLADLGPACAAFHNAHVRNLRAQRIQCDEIWQFVGKKRKAVRETDPDTVGDQFTFVALSGSAKAIVSYYTGKRTAEATYAFAKDVRSRVLGAP